MSLDSLATLVPWFLGYLSYLLPWFLGLVLVSWYLIARNCYQVGPERSSLPSPTRMLSAPGGLQNHEKPLVL